MHQLFYLAKGHSSAWGQGAIIFPYLLIAQSLKSWINLNPLGLPGSTKTINPLGAVLAHRASKTISLSLAEDNSSKTYPQ